ncbi:MAG: phasin family protein [Alphaproteobacteria bacterium]|nr:phasin family protein [Alphaproteobacteria bacterium]MDX5367774.1 phasin family protein [Alphaproteobacteria bacterium]MDX5462657.1 phasin family protein [Alphaproteobacteria bacterium]
MAKDTFTAASFDTFFKKGFENASKNFEDMSAFAKDNVDALMASANVTAKGSEEIIAEVMAFTKKSMEDSAAISKNLTTVKSVEDFVAVQADFTKTSFETFVSEMTKLSDMMIDTSKKAFEPINARVVAAGDVINTATKAA